MQLDYPDAYSSKFGHRLLYSYSPQSNLILVLVGILVFISVCVVANQHNNHTNAVSFIRIAAEKNLSASRGGWPVGIYELFSLVYVCQSTHLLTNLS